MLALAVSLSPQSPPPAATISSGQVQYVSVDAETREVVMGVVEQSETDLTVTVLAPDGRPVGTYDSRERAAEPIAFVAGTTGTYRVEIRAVAPNIHGAAYTVRLDHPRPPAPDDDVRIEAIALHTRAKQLFAKGDAESLLAVLEALRKARPLWQHLGERSLELAALAGTGDALYSLSQYAAAEPVYVDALALGRELGDRRTQAEVLNNLAMVAWPLGKIAEALDWLQQAYQEWRVVGFRYGETIAINNRGIVLRESGEYDEARQHYLRALALFRSMHDRRGEAYVLNNMSQVLDALGDRQEALAYLGRAVTLFRESGDRLAEGRALVRRGRIQLALGRRQAALVTAQQGLRLIRLSADRLAEADGLSLLGRTYAAAAEWPRGRAEYERALAIYRSVGSRRGEADALHDIGLSHLLSGDAERALPFLEQAREIRRAVGLRAVEADSLVRMSEAKRALDQLDAARADLEAALTIAEELRAGVFDKQLRASFAGSKDSYYAAYVDLLVALHRRRPLDGYDRLAFQAVERARALGLTELLRSRWSGGAAAVDAALVAREDRLRKEINYWSWQLWQQADRPAGTAREALARATLDRLMAEHATAEADIRRHDPRYAAMVHPETLPVDVLQRELLDADTVLLAYALGPARSFVWAITTTGVTLADLPGRASIEGHARRFAQIVGRGADAQHRPADTGARDREAAALTRLLLAPVAAALTHRRVLVVADGAIQHVPFAALPDPIAGSPLVRRHELVLLPSATVLALLRRDAGARAPAPRTLAVLADPVFDRRDPRVAATPAAAAEDAFDTGLRRLTRLPYSRDEAERILALVPADLSLRAIDFDANRRLATSAAIGQYKIIHFATHAFQDDRHPELSGIVLSMVDASGAPQDGFLRLHDVYTLQLRADLVVLSACETGLGDPAHGDGVSSLARGILHAGAARVVSTLWKVDDEATAAMMQMFYEALLGPARLAPAAALRAAQSRMRERKRWSDPYYWSGFVLQGEW